MSGSLANAAPVRFLIGVVALWATGRGIALVGWRPPVVPTVSAPAILHTPKAGARGPLVMALPLPLPLRPPARPRALLRPAAIPATEGVVRSVAAPFNGNATAAADTYRRSDGIAEAHSVAAPALERHSRWSGTVWAFVRGGGRASALSPGGQIGGGQAGGRLLYRLDGAGRLAASARLSGTIGGARQTEGAVGLDWKPVEALPVHVMVERRVAIDRGGRNAWTAGVAGGVDAVPLAPGWRLDGYAEAGVVGSRRRDLYADGAARVGRAVDLGAGRSLTLGGGLWGAAQPGAARLDAGPSAVLRLPVTGRTVALALDWRERVLGDARPSSGVAFTVAADF